MLFVLGHYYLQRRAINYMNKEKFFMLGYFLCITRISVYFCITLVGTVQSKHTSDH